MEYLFITYFFLVATHYLEIDALSWKKHLPIRLVINYVIGTVGMLSPFIWWLAKYSVADTQQIIIRLICHIVAAGLAPVSTHMLDYLKETKRIAREKAEHVAVLEGQIESRRNES